MELDSSLFQGRPPSLEEGPMNYQNSNKYIFDRHERKTVCNRFIQIVKVIFYIELIIVIGWLGCVLIAEYNGSSNNDEVQRWINRECETSEIGCTVYEIHNGRNDENIEIGNRREIRSVDDIEVVRERCQLSVNTTLRRFDDLASRVVIGESSDANIVKLRQRFVQEMIFLTLRVIFVQSNDTLHATALTNEQWSSFAFGIKQSIVNSADTEHRHRLEASGPLSQEIINEIRDTVQSMARDYMNCETILPTPRLGNSKGTKQQALRLVEIVLERERCGNSLNMTQEKLLALTAQIVIGESADPIVARLRQDAGSKLMSIPQTFLGDIRDEAIIKTGLANLSNADWQTLLVELKKELSTSTDIQHQQQLERSGPPTQEMANELRDIVEYFLVDHRKCQKLYANMLSAGKVKRKRQQALRSRRASGPLKYSTNDCLNDEKELLEDRRARLAAIANADLSGDPPKMRTEAFLDAVETALNATIPSEVRVADDLLQNDYGLMMWKQFMSNSSLELKKELYELIRDEFLELRKARSQPEVWEGFDLSSVYTNFTNSMFSSYENITLENVFHIIVKCGKSFNFHYLEVETENRLNDPKTPVFGTLVYLDKEPEKLGVRHMRHILNGYVRLYFRALNLPGPCHPIGEPRTDAVTSATSHRNRRFIKKRSVAERISESINYGQAAETSTEDKRSMKKRFASADPKPKPITTTCWSKEQETVLLEERQKRLEAFSLTNVSDSPRQIEMQQRFFNAIETALNATSTSEIRIDEEIVNSSMVLRAIHYLVSNTSLELHKEGYELCRDLFIEMHKLNYHDPDWENYDVYSITTNITSATFVVGPDMTSQTIFSYFVNMGKAFNLRYVELEIRDSEDEPNKLVFGKFINLGEKPEQTGVRNLRHILDGFVRFYFKTQYPSRPRGCSSRDSLRADSGAAKTSTSNEHDIRKRFVIADDVPKPIITTCLGQKQNAVLLEERRERLEAFAKKNATDTERNSFTQTILSEIERVLNATSISEIRLNETLMERMPMLSFIGYLVTNASLELHKEGFEFSRDLFLEMLQLRDRSPEWEGYDEDSLTTNITQEHRILFFRGNASAQTMFKDYIRFGEAFNLRYDELETKDSDDESNKPLLGKFTYLGEEPEKLGLRRLRHILDGFVRFYFKTQRPSSTACNTNAELRAEVGENETHASEKRSVRKRFVTEDPLPASSITCWNLEQDAALLQERRERLEAFAKRNATASMRNSYMQYCLQSIEAALNATSISEINFDEDLLRSTPALMFIEELAANSSLELRKEGYEFSRDLYLEMIQLSDRSPDWEGYNEDSIAANISENVIFDRVNATSESIFNDFRKLGEIFNLRYDELAIRDSDVELSEPVFGKFTYLGENPEKLGVRRLRHILDSFVKVYFKIQNPLSPVVCNPPVQRHAEGGEAKSSAPEKHSVEKRFVTEDALPAFGTMCWALIQDMELLIERQERLKYFAKRNATDDVPNAYMQNYLKNIETALNATNVSEIHFDEDLLRSTPALIFIEIIAANSSLELRKEGYEFTRDLYLEMMKLTDHSPEWEGYNEEAISANISGNVIFNHVNATSQSIFNDFIKFGEIFNLRYDELVIRDSEVEPSKPVFGKFTYVGEEPEKVGVSRLRHILDSFVKIYFKIQEPLGSIACYLPALLRETEESGTKVAAAVCKQSNICYRSTLP